MATSNDSKVNNFIINEATEEILQKLANAGQIEPNQIWVTPDDTTLSTNIVNLTDDQTINGIKTFEAPANISGTEQTTTKFKTSNSGALIIGKEGKNSGTMLNFQQEEGTTRLKL